MNTKVAKKKFSLSSPSVLLALAAVLAGGVTWGAFIYLQNREESIKADLAAQQARQQTPKISVVVPKKDSEPGALLNANAFVAREIDSDLVYPDTVLAKDFDSVSGAKLARPVLHGRPVRMSDLQPPEVKDIAALLKPGLRALTLDIDELNSISNTIRVGHKVDIFLISKGKNPADSGKSMAGQQDSSKIRLFMQNVTILATGKNFHDPNFDSVTEKMARPGEITGGRDADSSYSTVTVLVKPEEAQKLLLGKELGTYRIALKGSKDSADMQLAQLVTSDIDGSVKQKNKVRDQNIEFIVGGGKSQNLISSMPQLPSQKKQEVNPAAQPATTPVASAVKNELEKAFKSQKPNDIWSSR